MSGGRAYPFVPYQRPRISPSESTRNADRFLETILLRRSIREFSPDPVPLEAVRAAIEAAGSAPSGANMQPWTFVVVTDPALRSQIREAAETEERDNYGGRMPPEWLEALEPLGTDENKPFLEIAPLLIVVFKHDWREVEGKKIRHYYVNESVGIACGFLLAALNAAGLSTLTHTPSPMGFLRELLERPAWEKPYLLIPVGYPADDCRVPAIEKKRLEEILIER